MLEGTSKNSTHMESTESFRKFISFIGHKISSQRIYYACEILFTLTKNLLADPHTQNI